MEVLHTHLLMILLGLVATVCVSGGALFSLPNKTWLEASPIRRKRILGFMALMVVALSPLIRLFRDPPPIDVALLQQSLLLADIGLLAVVLFALLQVPYKQAVNEDEAAPIIELETNDAKSDTLLDNPAPVEIVNNNDLDEAIDLSLTDGLFSDSASDNFELPDNDEWLAQDNETVDLEQAPAIEDHVVVAEIVEATPAPIVEPEENIIEGELDDSVAVAEVVPFDQSELVLPLESINELLLKLSELQDRHRQLLADQEQGENDEDPMSINKEQLLLSEINVRKAADAVIRAQSNLLESYKDQADRSKAMAKNAAALARKATQAHNALKDIAKREKQARIQSQEKAKKAVDIARDAVNALAIKEKENSSVSP